MIVQRDLYEELELDKICNRNERKVLLAMERLFATVSGQLLTDKDKADIYALALNILPAAYAHPGTIVLGGIPDELVDQAVLSAYDSVVSHPKL